ncbi:MAG TPA: M56 family metallopeptidase [Thermoanaerobaculia bacterium]|jgi:beta-lactamase regulating signal transducer with metallopeptidase domain|nr:M56 family metallopeptidase [Thermoanaerobaculia bacterium]
MSAWGGLETLVVTLTRASIEGGLFIAGVWIVCRLLPRLPASLRCGLWWAACLKLLLGLVALPAVRLPLLPAAMSAAPVADVRPLSIRTVDAAPGRPLTPDPSPVPSPPPSPGEGSKIDLREVGAAALVALWVAGLLILCRKAFRQLRYTRWIVRSAEPVREGWVRAAFAEICERLGIRRAPDLRGSGEVRTPQVTGLAQPVVLIPNSGFERLTPAEVSMTLCHELVHLRRKDLWLGWVPALAHRIFFFHPLAALAVREYAIAREAACDAEVLRILGSAPQAYGRLLLRWGVAPRETGLAAAGASPSLQNLKRRLQMLQQNDNKRRVSGWWWLAGAAVLAGLVPLRIVAQDRAAEGTPVAEVAEAAEPAAAPEAVVAGEPAPAPEAMEIPEAAIAEGVRGGAAGGIEEGVEGGIEDGVAGGVEGAVAGGVAGGVGRYAPVVAPAAPAVPGTPRPALAPRAALPVPAPVLTPRPAHAPRAARLPVPTPRPALAPMPAQRALTPTAQHPAPPVLPALPALPPARALRPGVAPRPVAMLAGSGMPAPAPRAEGYARSAPPPAPPAPPRAPRPPAPPKHSESWYQHGAHGDSYVLLYGDDDSATMSGSSDDLRRVKRMRTNSHEDFLWFRHDGKEYVVRDAALLKQVKDLSKAQGELGGRQGELGGRQGALGAKQGALGAKQGTLGAEQGALAADRARRGGDADDRDLERRERELDRKQEELSRQQEELGRQQEVLGKQQEELGRQQEELGRKAEREMKMLIERAIQSGAAQEVR